MEPRLEVDLGKRDAGSYQKLGASSTSFAYEISKGVIINGNEEVQTGLRRVKLGATSCALAAVVTMEVELLRQNGTGSVRFFVRELDGKNDKDKGRENNNNKGQPAGEVSLDASTSLKMLPFSSDLIVRPAFSLSGPGQRVTLRRLRYLGESGATDSDTNDDQKKEWEELEN